MSGQATLESLRIRAYRREDERQVLDLLLGSLGPGPAGERSPEFFRWKHERNVFGRSYMLVAEADDRIVALRAFMRWRFRLGGTSLPAVRAVDTATHPEYRGLGIFSRLTRQALAALTGEIGLVFNTPNASSLPGYLKMGWRTVGAVPVWIRVRRPVRFAGGVRALDAVAAPATPRPRIDAPAAADALHDGAAVLSLLQRAGSPGDAWSTARDAAYLRWRYAEAPALDYRAIRLAGGRDGEGLAVFRVRPRGPLWETTLAEMIVPRGDARSARRLLRRVAAAARADHVTSHFSAASGGRPGLATGFLPAPRGVHLVVNPVDNRISPDPTALGSWALSLGDVELF